jgi:hypothetical protein
VLTTSVPRPGMSAAVPGRCVCQPSCADVLRRTAADTPRRFGVKASSDGVETRAGGRALGSGGQAARERRLRRFSAGVPFGERSTRGVPPEPVRARPSTSGPQGGSSGCSRGAGSPSVAARSAGPASIRPCIFYSSNIVEGGPLQPCMADVTLAVWPARSTRINNDQSRQNQIAGSSRVSTVPKATGPRGLSRCSLASRSRAKPGGPRRPGHRPAAEAGGPVPESRSGSGRVQVGWKLGEALLYVVEIHARAESHPRLSDLE